MNSHATTLVIWLSVAVAASVIAGGQPGGAVDASTDSSDRLVIKAKPKKPKGRETRREDRNRELPNPFGAERAAVRVEGAMTLAPFKVGVPVWGNTDRYRWTKTPAAFDGFFFTQFDSNHQGLTEFEVRSAGRVFLAVTSRWGEGGNRSGGWVQELTSQDDFLTQGWKRVAKIVEERGDTSHGHHWVIYERNCEKGERFRLRTEKYCAPILLF